MARDIGSAMLSGFQSTFNRGDPLKDKLLASAYNDERNKEISRQNASTITEFEMNFTRKGGNKGKSIADILGTDLIAGQDKLPPGGMATLLNEAGMNVTFGAGPNMSFSDVRLGKDEDGEDAVLLSVASIENEQDERGFFNIRARRNAVTQDGVPEAEGGKPIAIPLDEFNAAYDMYKRNAALGTGNEHLIKQLDPTGAAFSSGILEPAVVEDPNQIGNVDLSIIEEVRKANERAIKQYQNEAAAGLSESGDAYNRSADETFIMDDIYNRGDKVVYDPTSSNPLAPGSMGTSGIVKGASVLDPKYASMLDHSGGKEIPFQLNAKEWNNTLSKQTREKLKNDFKANTMDTFNKQISRVQRTAEDLGIPPPNVAIRMAGTDEEYANRVGAHKLIKNKTKELRDAFYKDKGLYGEFLDDPEAFAFKYSDKEGNFVNWETPKPDRKVVKELVNLSKKIDNPELKKALNAGDTAKITSLLEQYGSAEQNLSSEGQESVVNQLVKQEGQSAYPKSMRAKLMYLMTADMPEDRALAWFNGAGGTYIDTGQWDRQSIANLKDSGLTNKERSDRDIKFVGDYKKLSIFTDSANPLTDDEKIPLTTFLETADEGQWEKYSNQAGEIVMDYSARALYHGNVDGIRTTNRDVKRIFAKTMEWGVTDGIWNSIVSLPIFRGMPNRGVLGDDAGNFVAVNKETNQMITDPNEMDSRTTVFWEIDTFGQGQRSGSVGYSKVASALSSMNNSSQIMHQMRIIAAQNARYANLMKQPIE